MAINEEIAIIGDSFLANGANREQGAAYIFAIYDFCVRDDTRNLLLLLNPPSGLYQFFDCSKNLAANGAGSVTITSCKIRLNGGGTNRSVSALVNPCTMPGHATIVISAPETPSTKTYTISDSDITNNTGACR